MVYCLFCKSPRSCGLHFYRQFSKMIVYLVEISHTWNCDCMVDCRPLVMCSLLCSSHTTQLTLKQPSYNLRPSPRYNHPRPNVSPTPTLHPSTIAIRRPPNNISPHLDVRCLLDVHITSISIVIDQSPCQTTTNHTWTLFTIFHHY